MLFLVATPIGNLGDISLRALDTLRAVDLVVSEDTRKTGNLLKHYQIKKPQLSFHEYNEAKHDNWRGEGDGGLANAQPAFSDRGLLARAAIAVATLTARGTACTAGVPAAEHIFTLWFSAANCGPAFFEGGLATTLIFYESPYRLKAFLQDALAVYGDRRAAIANDLTKMFEAVERGTLSELLARYETQETRGEYTVVIAGREEGRASSVEPA